MLDSSDVEMVSRSIDRVARAIFPDKSDGPDASGNEIGSLVEAVMGITAGLMAIAGALNRLADTAEEGESALRRSEESQLKRD